MTFSTTAFIDAKRYRKAHSPQEIETFIQGMLNGEIADYQVSAWLMAVCCNGLTADETAALTQAYVDSGQVLDLSRISRPTVDKHSTGGVGDKTTLAVIAILAACGCAVAKLSGRGLGLTGGTIDKLESIAGFNVALSNTQFLNQVESIGVAIASQTADLAPADGKTYALRDVTATVSSLPLIAASVMSKKIAAGAQTITLDVKWGEGAFMPTLSDAKALAQACIDIGTHFGRNTDAVISEMNQPLGSAVGNANEVAEAIAVLKNQAPQDITNLVYELCEKTLVNASLATSTEMAKTQIDAVITSGKALDVFKQLIHAQGGNPAVCDDPSLLPQAAQHIVIAAEQEGTITACSAKAIAQAAFALGAGRIKKTDAIDYAVGVNVHAKIGGRVTKGQPLATLLANTKGIEEAQALCQAAFKITATA